LVWRDAGAGREVLLVHPGGPFWARKDEGAWTIPKGLVEDGEDPFEAAKREFAEETGFEVPAGPFESLGEIRQKSGKHVVAWAAHGDYDPGALVSNEVEIDWPPRSGKKTRIPEVDRAAYFDAATARTKILAAQVELLDRFFGT
jgi:predicted NUDIX family NTP pyrophosphohydrolase